MCSVGYSSIGDKMCRIRGRAAAAVLLDTVAGLLHPLASSVVQYNISRSRFLKPGDEDRKRCTVQYSTVFEFGGYFKINLYGHCSLSE